MVDKGVLLIQLFLMQYSSADSLYKQVEMALENVEEWRRGYMNIKMALSVFCRIWKAQF